MRLIACSDCHAQYDVSAVMAESIACSCGATLKNEAPQSVDATIQRCGGCGAHTGSDCVVCEYCGADITPVGDLSLLCPECFAGNAEASRFCTACGIAFQPQVIPIQGHEVPCPSCDVLMPPSQVAGIGLNECLRCKGLWVPGENFEALVERATQLAHAASSPAPRSNGGNPAQREVRYRKCPDCQGFMQRRNYRRSSGVVLDVCHEHGTWLDSDELEEIAGFILAGGQTSQALEAEHAATSYNGAATRDSAARARAATAQQGSVHWGASTPAGGGLLRILSDLFSLA